MIFNQKGELLVDYIENNEIVEKKPNEFEFATYNKNKYVKGWNIYDNNGQ